MTTKVKFPQVDFQASKRDEIAWLKEAAAAVAPGTYLAALLNPRLIEFFQTQAENDFPTDLMDYYAYEKKIAQERGEELRKVQRALETAEVDCETALAEQKKSWEVTCDGLMQDYRTTRDDANRLAAELATTLDVLDKERKTIADLTADLAAAEDEIIRLKAKLYDVMMAA